MSVILREHAMSDERPVNDDEPVEATLVFHEQSDGRKIGRLAGGKVVLIHVTSRPVLSRELAYVADKPVFFLEDFRTQLERDARPQ
jgi:hypothetical protein